MSISEYRASEDEKTRTDAILGLTPTSGSKALDVGARDGHFSILLADRFQEVVALDLEEPSIHRTNVVCVKGNAEKLQFAAREFDFVLCAEVLEHIPMAALGTVCREIERVANQYIVIGVPFEQDTRIGQLSCRSCQRTNPPYGHINSFDQKKLTSLFRNCVVEKTVFVGKNSERTNRIAVWLLDFAGNPYGTYDQDEPCIYCGRKLQPPTPMSLPQKIASKIGQMLARFSSRVAWPKPRWIHVQLRKSDGPLVSR